MAALPTKKSRWQRFVASRLTVEIPTALLSLIPVGISCHVLFIDKGNPVPPSQGDWTVLWSAIATTALILAKAFRDHADDRKKESLEPIDGAIRMLRTMLIGAKEDGANSDVRMCVYVYDPNRSDKKMLLQLTHYCGGSRDGRGRTRPIEKGAIGKAARSGEMIFARLPPNTNLIDYLVDQWGFTREEAAAAKPDRKSWAAIPVGELGRLLCVIYCDTNNAEFFGAWNSIRRKMLESAVPGIADFILDRYK